MNFTLHQFTQKIIHEAMSRNLRLSRESGAYQTQLIVPAAACGAGVADMTGAVVAYVDRQWFEGRKLRQDTVDGRLRHPKALSSGG